MFLGGGEEGVCLVSFVVNGVELICCDFKLWLLGFVLVKVLIMDVCYVEFVDG